jgi:hypothetical protein
MATAREFAEMINAQTDLPADAVEYASPGKQPEVAPQPKVVPHPPVWPNYIDNPR